MYQEFYNVGDRFRYSGTEYTIKTVTESALEIGCNAEQSLWVSHNQLNEKLDLKDKSAYFHWQNKYLVEE